MSAWDEVVAKFDRPHVDVFGPTNYRVWVQYGWHVHDDAATSDPVGQGRSLEKACRKLLDYLGQPAVMLVEGPCSTECRARYAKSETHQRASRARYRTVVEEAANAVEHWPAWKRGLDPCEDDECERELGHEGKHRRAKPTEYDEW